MTALPEEVSNRRVLKIALPIVLSNATVPILGAVDTGVVGQMGAAAPIGAVGLGAIVLGGVYWIFGFLRMGTTGLVAQALGAGDKDEVEALLARALLIALLAGLGLILVQVPLYWLAFSLAPASAEVEGMARDYMSIRLWSAPAAIGLYGITGWLIAAERTRAVLVIQVWMNGLNILLDLWFVLGLGWGVGGVATATAIAEWTGFALGLWLCRAVFAGAAWKAVDKVFAKARWVQMLVVNSAIMIRSVLLQIAFTSFLFLGADFGDVTLAANQILLQFLYITAYGLDGFAFAAEALVGSALGARERARLRRASFLTAAWGFGLCCCLSVAFALFGGALVDIMATSPEVREMARVYLPWMVLAPIVGSPSWMLDGIFIGATRSRDMRNMMVIAFTIYCLAAVLLIPPYANHGLWAALLIFFIARGITLGWRYPALEAAADAPKG